MNRSYRANRPTQDEAREVIRMTDMLQATLGF